MIRCQFAVAPSWPSTPRVSPSIRRASSASGGRVPRFIRSQYSERGTLPRSEEHTSELQSHVNLVCRLLLEKKKKTQPPPYHDRTQKAPTPPHASHTNTSHTPS